MYGWMDRYVCVLAVNWCPGDKCVMMANKGKYMKCMHSIMVGMTIKAEIFAIILQENKTTMDQSYDG